MNLEQKEMFMAIANSDLNKARKYAKLILEANNKKCDQGIKNRVLTKLSTNVIELPQNVKGLIEAEDVENYFTHNRYVTTDKDDAIVNKVIDTWNIREKLEEYNIKYLNSLMLYGVPGCGKTMLGRYIAYKTKLPFMYLNFSNLISSYLGKTGENLQKVFDYIKDNRCVLMIDELDAVGLERGRSREIGEMDRIVINLMQCLDKVDMNCIIIAATNRADMIDKALLRRFSLKYEIERPSNDVKKAIVKSYLDSMPSNYSDIDLEKFVNENYSCSDLTNSLINRIIECFSENKEITLY